MEKKEAMKILKEFHDKSALFSVRTALDTIIPELAESDGERIRKELIKVFSNREKYLIDQSFGGITVSEAIAWLEKQGEKESDPRYENLEELLAADDIYQMSMNDEMVQEAKEKAVNALSGMCIGRLLGLEKQGEYKETLCEKCKREHPSHSCQDITELGRCAVEHEQKSDDKVEPKFKISDWIINNDKRIAVPTQILEIEKYGYVTSRGYISFDIVKTDYHLWTIQDANDGDVLASNGSIILFKEISNSARKDYKYIQSHCLVLAHSSDFYTGGSYNLDDRFHPATKEQRDKLEKAITEAGYKWDAEKKELKK